MRQKDTETPQCLHGIASRRGDLSCHLHRLMRLTIRYAEIRRGNISQGLSRLVRSGLDRMRWQKILFLSRLILRRAAWTDEMRDLEQLEMPHTASQITEVCYIDTGSAGLLAGTGQGILLPGLSGDRHTMAYTLRWIPGRREPLAVMSASIN